MSASTDLPTLSSSCPMTTNEPPAPESKTPSTNYSTSIPPITIPDTPAPPPAKLLTPKFREAAVRAAQREIAAKLREDWTWPPPSSDTSPQPDAPSTPIQWRERDSDSSYAPASPISHPDPYRFDTPDSITPPTPLSRKRKRQQRLEEEMSWNSGLRVFVERRDLWAGASTPSTLPSSTSSTSPTASPSSPQTLIPLSAPILPPTNPIRASIVPSTYPSIYDKIIIRGQAPSIPINLSDVVGALVVGWKKDGEWPPKSQEGGEVRVNRLARRGVGRMRRVFGFGRGEGV